MEDLRGYAAPELETSNTSKIMGAVVVALGVLALGAYTFSAGIWDSPSQPREMASTEPQPVKITKPVVPAPVSVPAPSDQHAADTTAVKPATKIAHARRSESASPAAPDNSASAPSVPSDAATPANLPAPQPEALPATGGQQPATPAPSDAQP